MQFCVKVFSAAFLTIAFMIQNETKARKRGGTLGVGSAASSLGNGENDHFSAADCLYIPPSLPVSLALLQGEELLLLQFLDE